WLSAALALLWAATAAGWWLDRRRLASRPAAAAPASASASASVSGSGSGTGSGTGTGTGTGTGSGSGSAAAKLPESRQPNPDAARRSLLQHCERGAAAEARSDLLDWADAQWPDLHGAGLQAIEARVTDAAFIRALRDLDRACFAGGPWDGAALRQAFAGLRLPQQKERRARDPLGSLYD
ncbi:MAG: hypothetical protein KGL43_19985, partial [Burkholderiales bacterium]|nr:hypothetical protein [Burkholderiales bacterium]